MKHSKIMMYTCDEPGLLTIGLTDGSLLNISIQDILDTMEMSPKQPKEDLNELYVDHLTQNLELRPVGSILSFLAKYCGWEELFSYIYNKVKEQRKYIK